MFSLELLPYDIIFQVALLLNLADIARLVCVLTGAHQRAVLDAFQSIVLRQIVSRGIGGCAIWSCAFVPALLGRLLVMQTLIMSSPKSLPPRPAKVLDPFKSVLHPQFHWRL